MSKGKIFRDALKRGMVTAPGCFECIGARAIERAGFEAVYMTGAGTAATLGYPDYGLLTMSEMADNAGRIATAIKLPVIAFSDSLDEGTGTLHIRQILKDGTLAPGSTVIQTRASASLSLYPFAPAVVYSVNIGDPADGLYIHPVVFPAN